MLFPVIWTPSIWKLSHIHIEKKFNKFSADETLSCLQKYRRNFPLKLIPKDWCHSRFPSCQLYLGNRDIFREVNTINKVGRGWFWKTHFATGYIISSMASFLLSRVVTVAVNSCLDLYFHTWIIGLFFICIGLFVIYY